jgi:uncharacterized protein (DUF2062 family)
MPGKTIWESYVESDGPKKTAVGCAEGCAEAILPLVGLFLLFGFIAAVLSQPALVLSALGLGLIWLVFFKRWK